jgi:hypothetical protein
MFNPNMEVLVVDDASSVRRTTSLSLLTPIGCRKSSIRYFPNRALGKHDCAPAYFFTSRAIESAVELMRE